MAANDSFTLFLQAVSSPQEYRKSAKEILNSLIQAPKSNYEDFSSSILKVITNKELAPIPKFYSVLLLSQATLKSNPELITHLSQCKDLYKKLFEDCQVDRDKPATEKGKKFFAKKPTKEEQIIGNNYISLVVELISYWAKHYGDSQRKSTGFIFFTLKDSLKEAVKFPEQYFFLKENLIIDDEFHLGTYHFLESPKSSLRDEKVPTEKSEPEKNDTSIEFSQSYAQVNECVQSAVDYQNKKDVIFENLKKYTVEYQKELIRLLSYIINNKDSTPSAKFFSVYLLANLMKSKDQAIAIKLAEERNLLNKLYKDAQTDLKKPLSEKGKKIFGSKPNHIIIGNNYVNLILECIAFWKTSFGTEDTKNPRILFNIMYNKISAESELPSLNYLDGSAKQPCDKYPTFEQIPFSQIKGEAPLNLEDTHQGQDLAESQIKIIIENFQSYKKHSEFFLKNLRDSTNEQYMESCIQALANLMLSKSTTPTSLFYSLLLLVKTTEIANKTVILALARQTALLERLARDGLVDQEKGLASKGRTYFPSTQAENSTIGNNYICLVLECLLFWHSGYGAAEPSSPYHAYTKAYKNISGRVKFANELVFVGKPLDLSGDSPLELQAYILENSPQAEPLSKEEALPSTKKTDTANETFQNNTVLAQLVETRKTLKDFFDANEEESEEVIQRAHIIHSDYMTASMKATEEISNLITEPSSSEHLVGRLLEENDTAEGVKKLFMERESKKIPFKIFRELALKILNPISDNDTTYNKSIQEYSESSFIKGTTPDEAQARSKLLNSPDIIVAENLDKENKDVIVSNEIRNEQIQSSSHNSEVKSAPVQQAEAVVEQQIDNQTVEIQQEKPEIHIVNTEPFVEAENSSKASNKENSTSKSISKKPNLQIDDVELPYKKIEVQIEQKEPLKEISIPEAQNANSSQRQSRPSTPKEKADSKRETPKTDKPVQNDRITPKFTYSEPKQPTEPRGRVSRGNSMEGSDEKASFRRFRTSMRETPEKYYESDILNISKNIERSKSRTLDASKLSEALKPARIFARQNFDPKVISENAFDKKSYEEFIEKLKKEKEQLSRENLLLKSQLEDKNEAGVTDRARQFSELQQKLESLTIAHQRTADENTVLIQENQDLKSQLEFALTELNKYKQSKAPESNDLISKLKLLQNQNESLSSTINDLKTKNKTLSQKLEELEELQTSVLYQSNKEEFVHKAQKPQKTETVYGRGRRMNSELRSRASPNLSASKSSDNLLVSDMTAKGNRTPSPEMDPMKKDSLFSFPSVQVQTNDHNSPFRGKLFPEASPSRLDRTEPSNINFSVSPNNPRKQEEDSKFYSPQYSPDKSEVSSVNWPSTTKKRFEETSEIDFGKFISGRPTLTQNKPARGIPVDLEQHYLKDLLKRFQNRAYANDLYSFLVSNMKNKSSLYEDNNLQIGFTSSVSTGGSMKKNLLKLWIYFGNKAILDIRNFTVTYPENRGFTSVIMPTKVESQIASGQQVKQQILLSFEKVPFAPLEMKVSYDIGIEHFECLVCLPSLINKFMDLKDVTADEFRRIWKTKNSLIWKTEELPIDASVIKSPYDFKKYFGYLVDLKPMNEYEFVQGKKAIKLGGVFDLDMPGNESLLKIHVYPNQNVVFQIATSENLSKAVIFLLQTLAFLTRSYE